MVNPSSWGKYPNMMICCLLEREILRRHISKNRKVTALKFCTRHAFNGFNDSCKISFQSVDGNHDFRNPGLLPPRPGERVKRQADRVKRHNIKNVKNLRMSDICNCSLGPVAPNFL